MDILTNIWLSKNIIIWYADWQMAFYQIDWLGTGHYLSLGQLEDFSCVTLKFTWFSPPPSHPIRLGSILNISPPLLSPQPPSLAINWQSTLFITPLYSVGNHWSSLPSPLACLKCEFDIFQCRVQEFSLQWPALVESSLILHSEYWTDRELM